MPKAAAAPPPSSVSYPPARQRQAWDLVSTSSHEAGRWPHRHSLASEVLGRRQSAAYSLVSTAMCAKCHRTKITAAATCAAADFVFPTTAPRTGADPHLHIDHSPGGRTRWLGLRPRGWPRIGLRSGSAQPPPARPARHGKQIATRQCGSALLLMLFQRRRDDERYLTASEPVAAGTMSGSL